MNGKVVASAEALLNAVHDRVDTIEVRGTISGLPMITLAPGTMLRGGTLRFGGKGLRLTRDNVLDDLTIVAPADEVAVLNDPSVEDLGRLWLRGLQVTGQVLLTADHRVRRGHVQAEGVHIAEADLRGRADRPRLSGVVEVMHGAFMLWNRRPDPAVVLTADLDGIGAGSAENPIRGGGVCVGGYGGPDGTSAGGTMRVDRLRTTAIHTDSAIPPCTPDLISVGVFVMPGAAVAEVVTGERIRTYGQNDVALDNWGEVEQWTVQAPVVSTGANGMGFVNAGAIGALDVQAPLCTFGTGARAVSLLAGTLGRVTLASIATYGAGAVGVLVRIRLPRLTIHGDLATEGGSGRSLIGGMPVELEASALRVLPAGTIGTVVVDGQIRSAGDHVTTVDIAGRVESFDALGGIVAGGAGSDAVHVRGEVPGLRPGNASARDGMRYVDLRAGSGLEPVAHAGFGEQMLGV
jgi:hypothetical protein